MKCYCLRFILFVFIILPAVKAHAYTLSDQAHISLIVTSPGSKLFEAFGHSMIRVYDPENDIDYAYNYGTFDFDTPNFYLKFARGKLKYKLDRGDYQLYKKHYIHHDRYIYEQIFNLNQRQKQELADYLEYNYKPENRYYLYDFFYNNCATKIRDVLNKLESIDVHFSNDFVEKQRTFRELIDLYTQAHPWGDLGIDLCLGAGIDKQASAFHHMYLPEYLMKGFQNASHQVNGDTKPLISEKKVIYKGNVPFPEPSLDPLSFFWGMFFFFSVITCLNYKKGIILRGIDFGLFMILGLTGILMLLLWFATDHQATAYNYNILWALPTHSIAAVVLLIKPRSDFMKYYFMLTTCISFLLLILWPVLPQTFNWCVIPVLFLLLIRSSNYLVLYFYKHLIPLLKKQ